MRRTKPHAAKPFDAIDALPFVRAATPEEEARGLRWRIFWSVIPSGDYGQDCALGEKLAELALAYMAEHDFPQLFQWAALDMIQTVEKRSGIEVAFLARFGRLALAAYQLLHPVPAVRSADVERVH